MNKAHRLSILLILLASLSANAMADDVRYTWGLGLGSSQFQLNKSELVASYSGLSNASTFIDSSTSFNAFGGVRFDQYLALELDLMSSGDIVAREAGRSLKLFDISTFALTLVGSSQLTEKAQVFGRLGVHFWDIAESAGSFDTINSAVDITYGAGIDINLYGDRSRQMRIQWNHYEYDGIYIDSSDTFSLSLIFLVGG
ncbi:MAG: outer membrane beta-barrel protein [Gammaproteobacteria bacterium]|nr:outer membrane beta-barrel protein [Gammaproteobacteria bacterium]MBL6998314.1 outer membrane beta-barrel protein [Gammaproteobacteria bacterium]